MDNAEAAFAELKSNGLEKEEADFSLEQHGETAYKVFFVGARGAYIGFKGSIWGLVLGASRGYRLSFHTLPVGQ